MGWRNAYLQNAHWWGSTIGRCLEENNIQYGGSILHLGIEPEIQSGPRGVHTKALNIIIVLLNGSPNHL